ncbi:MAG: hypothetical protein ABI540_02345 [Spartobacteria bacterium]
MNGKPQLHVYANQDADDLKQAKDFLAPQLISGTSDFDSAKGELEKARLHQKNGAATLAISVDASGKVTNMKVASENPQLQLRPRRAQGICQRALYPRLPQRPAGCLHLRIHQLRHRLSKIALPAPEPDYHRADRVNRRPFPARETPSQPSR